MRLQAVGQPGVDLADALGHQRDVTVVVQQPGLHPGDAGREPLAVAERDELVLPAAGAGEASEAAAVTRSGSSAAQASRCGPPPEMPHMARRSMPSPTQMARTSAGPLNDSCHRICPLSAGCSPHYPMPSAGG